MTDGRLVYSQREAIDKAQRDRTAEAIGDGSTVTPEDFAAMGYRERAQLHAAAPDKYAELAKAATEPRRFGQ